MFHCPLSFDQSYVNTKDKIPKKCSSNKVSSSFISFGLLSSKKARKHLRFFVQVDNHNYHSRKISDQVGVSNS